MDDKLMFIIWELVVVLMVIIVLTISVKGIANNTSYWKRYHSADLALMTDLIIANQGDFSINYDMKDIRHNFVTRAMRIDPLVFQIFLKEDAFFVYDQSIDKDRFPQSFIFSKDKDVTVSTSNTSNDYIVLYKEEDNVGMKDNYISTIISCPSEDTKGDLSTKRFEVMSLSDETKTYGSYITDRLQTVGKGYDDEALFTLTTSTTDSTTIFYDSLNPLNQVRSEKMACLIQRQLLQKFPDMKITSKPYDMSAEIEPFANQRNNYMYWVLISVNTSQITTTDLSDSIKNAIVEYYG